MGGMVLETNMNEIVAQIEAQNRLEKSEVSAHLYFAPAGSKRLGQKENGYMCWFMLLWNLQDVYAPLSSLSPPKPID